MSWTASIINIERDYFNARVTVSYTNGSQTLSQDYRVSALAVLKSLVTTQLQQLQAIDNLVSTVPTGSFDPSQPPPTPDPALDQFLNTLHNVTQLQKGVALGIFAATDPIVVNATANLKSQFVPRFLDFLV